MTAQHVRVICYAALDPAPRGREFVAYTLVQTFRKGNAVGWTYAPVRHYAASLDEARDAAMKFWNEETAKAERRRPRIENLKRAARNG